MTKWKLTVKTGAGTREFFIFAESDHSATELFRKQWGAAYQHSFTVVSTEPG